MLNEKVKQLLNEQVNKELYSAYLYLDVSNHYDDLNLDGFANWFMIQAQEERDHAMLIYQYLHNNDIKVDLAAIAKPDKKFDGKKQPLEITLAHEIYVTSLINAIYDAAFQVKDFRTMQFLDWFVKEQCEEEKNSRELIAKMDLFGDDARSLYMLNQELAGRKYNAPSLVLD